MEKKLQAAGTAFEMPTMEIVFFEADDVIVTSPVGVFDGDWDNFSLA